MIITAFFTENGSPKTGLSPIIDIWLVNGDEVISGASMIEVAGGFYKYAFTSYAGNNDYCFRADGGASLPSSERYLYSSNELAGIWDERLADHKIPYSTGYRLKHITGGMLQRPHWIKDDVWTVKEKEDLIKLLGDITKQREQDAPITDIIKELSESLLKNTHDIVEIKDLIIKEIGETLINHNNNIVELANLIHKLEQNPEITKEEIKAISDKINDFHNLNKESDILDKIGQLESGMDKINKNQDNLIQSFLKTVPNEVLDDIGKELQQDSIERN